MRYEAWATGSTWAACQPVHTGHLCVLTKPTLLPPLQQAVLPAAWSLPLFATHARYAHLAAAARRLLGLGAALLYNEAIQRVQDELLQLHHEMQAAGLAHGSASSGSAGDTPMAAASGLLHAPPLVLLDVAALMEPVLEAWVKRCGHRLFEWVRARTPVQPMLMQGQLPALQTTRLLLAEAGRAFYMCSPRGFGRGVMDSQRWPSPPPQVDGTIATELRHPERRWMPLGAANSSAPSTPTTPVGRLPPIAAGSGPSRLSAATGGMSLHAAAEASAGSSSDCLFSFSVVDLFRQLQVGQACSLVHVFASLWVEGCTTMPNTWVSPCPAVIITLTCALHAHIYRT